MDNFRAAFFPATNRLKQPTSVFWKNRPRHAKKLKIDAAC